MHKWVKRLVFALALVPALSLVYLGFTNGLGVNPAETLQLETGTWALRFLVATLAITPLRRLTGWNRAVQYRRMLGLYAFFYAFAHFLTYLVLDQSLAFGQMLADVAKRPFITMGFIAFVLMIPLAITSTRGWIRRLGRQWQMLHRLIYVSGIAASVHYIWKVKVALGPPVYYAVGVALLLGFRVAWQLRSAKSIRTQHVKA
ncbi:MAG: methionine sulfoxide reductase heme-binding subunit [Acidobacteriota bacterium]|jgi:sulfoxide reductase heme-binding subunit YedZ